MSNLRYTILSGDTLSGIAGNINSSAGISYLDIEKANPDVNPSALQVGEKINIPSGDGSSKWIYTILSGDSFSLIASQITQSAGVTYQDIETANPTVNPNALQVGTVLDIPQVKSEETASAPAVPAPNIGYWDWTWSPTPAVAGATMGIAFSGWANVDNAVSESAQVINSLVGEKYISLGGGAVDTGSITASFLTSVNEAIQSDRFADYEGIAYDIEVGDSGLSADFATSFAAAKAKGFKVLVTVSHSVPFGIDDAAALMQGFFADENIDFISPQLYTSGEESSNDYADPLLPWTAYASSKAKIIPSIVKASYYPDAVSYFEAQGVTLEGYIQWAKSS